MFLQILLAAGAVNGNAARERKGMTAQSIVLVSAVGWCLLQLISVAISKALSAEYVAMDSNQKSKSRHVHNEQND